MRKLNLLLVLGVIAIFAGCSSEPDKYDVENYDEISDPALLYCVKQGGKLISSSEHGVRKKQCQFSENEKYDVYDYYQKSMQSSQQ
ncbi:DUF333 domain-containing protein [Vibrio sp. JC009]|uniref:DUF333 domain-containing protein n=1 Tax=Vibrio sp. JC009 TaxID=2912314 RepID=UPI0023AEDA57|nr:DUF333 domain-containing protein [Vibrio sp. JC009]WED24484.1 DUF333 domain-containing protein [Vibrio sp. JC009]